MHHFLPSLEFLFVVTRFPWAFVKSLCSGGSIPYLSTIKEASAAGQPINEVGHKARGDMEIMGGDP